MNMAANTYDALIGKERFIYIVKPGDTVSRIIHSLYNLQRGTERYAYAEAHLCYLNGIKDPNQIRVGQSLIITPLPLPEILTRSFKQPADIINQSPRPPFRTNTTLPITLATKPEQDMFWALSWFQQNSNWLTIPGAMVADASGRILHEQNIGLLREVKTLYDNYKAGRITKNQYDYGRQKALKQFSSRVGPLEKLMFGGRTSQEAMRIARGGAIPATQNIIQHASRLSNISKAARFGAPVILSGASLAAGCMQIAHTDNRVEKNEVLVETITSTAVGVALGVILFSNPIGWGVALVVVAGSAAASYGSGKLARHIYDKNFRRFDLVSDWKIDRLCQ